MTRRRTWQIVLWVATVVAVAVIVSALRGAGVPVSLPGVFLCLVGLAVVRVFVGRARRRRARTEDARRR